MKAVSRPSSRGATTERSASSARDHSSSRYAAIAAATPSSPDPRAEPSAARSRVNFAWMVM